MACQKRPLTEGMADDVLAGAAIARVLNPRTSRRECAKYFCRECRMWHTTSKPQMPPVQAKRVA